MRNSGGNAGRARDLDATVAIPTLNPDLRLLTEVLRRASAIRLPIVVVDMSAAQHAAEACRSFGSLVRYDWFPQSTGVSQSRNRCAELAQTTRIIYLDSDALPIGDWATPMLTRLDEDDVGVVGAKILPLWAVEPPRLFHCTTAKTFLSLFDAGGESCDVPRVIGTSYAFDRTRVPTPPFNESLGRRPGWGVSGEENRLCAESRAMGFRVIYEPDSLVLHSIDAHRVSWRWMWRRAFSAGQERRLVGPEEPLFRTPRTLTDNLFRATIAVPFLIGKWRPAPVTPTRVASGA